MRNDELFKVKVFTAVVVTTDECGPNSGPTAFVSKTPIAAMSVRHAAEQARTKRYSWGKSLKKCPVDLLEDNTVSPTKRHISDLEVLTVDDQEVGRFMVTWSNNADSYTEVWYLIPADMSVENIMKENGIRLMD